MWMQVRNENVFFSHNSLTVKHLPLPNSYVSIPITVGIIGVTTLGVKNAKFSHGTKWRSLTAGSSLDKMRSVKPYCNILSFF